MYIHIWVKYRCKVHDVSDSLDAMDTCLGASQVADSFPPFLIFKYTSTKGCLGSVRAHTYQRSIDISMNAHLSAIKIDTGSNTCVGKIYKGKNPNPQS